MSTSRTRFPAGRGVLNWCFLLAVSIFGAAEAGRVVESPLLRAGDTAVEMCVDVAGEKEILLTATVGPDNSDYDQAIWAEPQFVFADGAWVDATKLSVPYATVGWGSWMSRPKRATASYRRAHRPYAPVFDVGFRIVVE